MIFKRNLKLRENIKLRDGILLNENTNLLNENMLFLNVDELIPEILKNSFLGLDIIKSFDSNNKNASKN